MTTYLITHSDGRTETHASYDAALVAIVCQYGIDSEAGHAGDLEDGGDRTLCWAYGADSIDDDGRHAVAKITAANAFTGE